MGGGEPSGRVLILSNPTDPHAFVIQEGLLYKGAEVHLWHTSDFPRQQRGSLTLGPNEADWKISGPELELGNQRIGSVWVRRPAPPVVGGFLQGQDRVFASRESTLFLRSMQTEIGQTAFWVNPPESRYRSLLRPAQLTLAARAGFSIPLTLCSNDPVEIREFVRAREDQVIYKSFFPVSWARPKSAVSILYTSIVRESDLPEDDFLQAAPGLYQAVIPKDFELRVTAMGHRFFSAKIRSQEVDAARLDWRMEPGEVPLEPFELPVRVAAACRQVMADLGIVFGCFDLIVTPQGEYVFLEVNEMGAFLWLEEKLPELRLLDAFCEFLLQARSDFQWSRPRATVNWQDVIERATQRFEAAPAVHVGLPHEPEGGLG